MAVISRFIHQGGVEVGILEVAKHTTAIGGADHAIHCLDVANGILVSIWLPPTVTLQT